jgi:pyridoxamine 5'-phosphate oxidase
MSPPWLPILRDALDLEWPHAPRVATLATVDRDNVPHARSVVVRAIEDAGVLHITSDARSGKNAHLRHAPSAELVFWLPARREQFRLAGRVTINSHTTDAPLATRLWESLPDASRALFHWPAPGQPLKVTGIDFPPTIAATTPVPESFEILTLHPDRVDHLQLAPTPHRRARYRAQNAWGIEPINP